MAKRVCRNVSLSPELNKLIDKLVLEGRFSTASEVIRAALRLLHGVEETTDRTEKTQVRQRYKPECDR